LFPILTEVEAGSAEPLLLVEKRQVIIKRYPRLRNRQAPEVDRSFGKSDRLRGSWIIHALLPQVL
jgi:hypothetical protein